MSCQKAQRDGKAFAEPVNALASIPVKPGQSQSCSNVLTFSGPFQAHGESRPAPDKAQPGSMENSTEYRRILSVFSSVVTLRGSYSD